MLLKFFILLPGMPNLHLVKNNLFLSIVWEFRSFEKLILTEISNTTEISIILKNLILTEISIMWEISIVWKLILTEISNSTRISISQKFYFYRSFDRVRNFDGLKDLFWPKSFPRQKFRSSQKIWFGLLRFLNLSMINDLILNKTSDNVKIFILTMISSFDHDKNSDCQKSVILS